MKALYIIFLLSLSLPSEAQNIEWLRSQHFSEDNESYGISEDKWKNVYVAGLYTQYIPDSSGNYNAGFFLSKYDAEGTLLWADTSSARFMRCSGVVCDNQGNAYVLIATTKTVKIGNTVVNYIPPSGNTLLVKYNQAGYPTVVKQIARCYGRGIVIDTNNDIYIMGSFSNTDFGNGNVLSENGAFLCKYSITGQCQWAKHTGTAGSTNVIAYNYATNVFVETDDNTIYSYDTSGNLTSYWNPGLSSRIGADKFGNLYLSGGFHNNITFGTTTLTDTTSDGSNFLVKRSSAGQYLWAKRIESPNYINFVVDSLNEIYCTSGYGDAFSSFAGIKTTKFDSSGSIVWSVDQNTGFLGGPVFSNGLGNIFVGGITLSGSLILKISNMIVTDINKIDIDNTIGVFPNPTTGIITVTLSNATDHFNIKILTTKGEVVYAKQLSFVKSYCIDVSKYNKGMYLLEIVTDYKHIVKRVVLQ